MKKSLLSLSMLAALFSWSQVLVAQMVIDAELRPRFEMRDGYKKLPSDTSEAAWVTSQRSRLNLSYSSARVKSRLSVQDVRLWGDEYMRADIPGIGLYEAWAELRLFDSLSAKAGRQELLYGNQRLLANVNWAQKGLAHDALVFKYKNKGLTLDFGTAFNQSGDSLFYTFNPIPQKEGYKSLNFIWATKRFSKFEISIAGIRDGFQSTADTTETEHRNTFGAVLKGKGSKWSYFFQTFLQSGHNQNGQEISAFYLNPELGFTVSPKLNVTLGAEIFSGNDQTDSTETKFRTFSTLYGTGHNFNGYMDYFTNMPSDTKNGGLVNPFIKTSWQIKPSLAFMADYHLFRFQNKAVNSKTGEELDQHLGSEIDLSLRYDFSTEVQVLAGYSLMFASESMEYLKKGSKDELAQWAMLMLTIRPTFFKSGK